MFFFANLTFVSNFMLLFPKHKNEFIIFKLHNLMFVNDAKKE